MVAWQPANLAESKRFDDAWVQQLVVDGKRYALLRKCLCTPDGEELAAIFRGVEGTPTEEEFDKLLDGALNGQR